jgi:hypothetical protein
VPCCSPDNSIAGARVFLTFADKRAYILERRQQIAPDASVERRRNRDDTVGRSGADLAQDPGQSRLRDADSLIAIVEPAREHGQGERSVIERHPERLQRRHATRNREVEPSWKAFVAGIEPGDSVQTQRQKRCD